MELDTWTQRLTSVCDTARYLHGLNVIDLSFQNGETWEVYCALRDDQRTRGLANLERDHLDVDGMIFNYPGGSFVPFSMAEMRFPLHVAWYDEAGSQIKHCQALDGDTTPLCSPRRFTWVLESPHQIPAGGLKVRHGA